MAVDRNGLEILTRAQCLELLTERPVGRVAISAYALPAILPVAFRLLGDDIVFATGTGSKSLAVSHGNVIAFEVDEIDPEARSGWSVLVVGRARKVLSEDPDWGEVRALELAPWVDSHTQQFIRLSTERVTGRRLPAGEHQWSSVPTDGATVV